MMFLFIGDPHRDRLPRLDRTELVCFGHGDRVVTSGYLRTEEIRTPDFEQIAITILPSEWPEPILEPAKQTFAPVWKLSPKMAECPRAGICRKSQRQFSR